MTEIELNEWLATPVKSFDQNQIVVTCGRSNYETAAK